MTTKNFLRLAVALAATLAAAQTQSNPTPPAAQPQPKTQSKPLTPPPVRKPGKVTAARIRVVPERYTGVCPAKLQFLGAITTDGPAEVKYTWVSSDGGSWPETTIKVPAAGTRPVNESREGVTPGKMENGWMQLKVLAPNAVQSVQAKYLIACTVPKPAATPAQPKKK